MRSSPLLIRHLRWLPIAVIICLIAVSARAQDSNDERRCTGQSRTTIDERIASCTALIDSGRYQTINLAVLRDNRGMALRIKGDLTNARKDFDEAINLNPDYARAFANRGAVLLAQHDLDGAL